MTEFLLYFEKKMQKLYHMLLQIPLKEVGEFQEIYGENTVCLWYLSSVQALSVETLCGDLRVRWKDPIPRLCAGRSWSSSLYDSSNSWIHHRPSHPSSGRCSNCKWPSLLFSVLVKQAYDRGRVYNEKEIEGKREEHFRERKIQRGK